MPKGFYFLVFSQKRKRSTAMEWQRSLATTEYLFIFGFLALYGVYLFRHYRITHYLRTAFKYAWIKYTLRTAYFLLMVLALLGPSFGEVKKEIEQVGKDIVIAVDLSRSMDVDDVAPSRLKRVQFEMDKLLEAFSTDRLGLVIFSYEAFMQCPMTSDKSALRMFLETLHTGLVPEGSTDFGPPLRMALNKLTEESETSRPEDSNAKVIILISDGEDFGDEAESIAEDIEDAGIRLFTLGIGTEKGGQVRDKSGRPLRTEQGEVAVSKLEAQDLKSLAERTGGRYFEISDNTNDTKQLINAIRSIQGKLRGNKKLDVSDNKYFYLLALALGLMVLDVLLTVKVVRV